MTTLKELMLSAPDGHLDAGLRPIVERWSDPLMALQVLELLDAVIHWGAGSTFVVRAIELQLQLCMTAEGITLADLIPLATWRK